MHSRPIHHIRLSTIRQQRLYADIRALGELLEHAGSLIIRHIDRVSALRLHTLSIALEQASAAGRQESSGLPSRSANAR